MCLDLVGNRSLVYGVPRPLNIVSSRKLQRSVEVSYELSWETNGVVFRYHGTVTDQDLTKSNEEVYSDPRFDQMRYQIVDFSSVEDVAVSSSTVARVAVRDQEASKRNPAVRVAIITSEPFVYGMSRLYSRSHEAMGGSWKTELFETEEQAREWVGA